MLLRDCEFTVSGYEISFTAFSDQLCRVSHIKSLKFETPGSYEQVAWYRVQPAPSARWVAIQETLDFDKTRLRFFLHEGQDFVERHRNEIPSQLLTAISRRLPSRTVKTQCRLKTSSVDTAVPCIKASVH